MVQVKRALDLGTAGRVKRAQHRQSNIHARA
jgi:hypothetical protein